MTGFYLLQGLICTLMLFTLLLIIAGIAYVITASIEEYKDEKRKERFHRDIESLLEKEEDFNSN